MSRQGYVMSRDLHDDVLRGAIDGKIALRNDDGAIAVETVKDMLAASLEPTTASPVLDKRIKALYVTTDWWMVDSAS